jgi:type IV pilus assembly protein PilM
MVFGGHAAVGLDIGSRVVKVVQLRRNGKSIELEKFGLAEISPRGEKPSAPEDQRRAKVEAIRRVLAEARISGRQAVTAVRGESVIVRYIPMPDMPPEELKNAFRLGAEEYTPYRSEEVNMDWSVIGASGEGSTRRLDVLLVCARKDLINDHVALVKEAGLSAEIVDVDCFAFLNCFELNYQPDPHEVIGLINVGGEITGISVYSGSFPRFSRDISIGGSTITTAMRQRLEMPLAQVEALKISRGVSKQTKKPSEDSAGGEPSLADTIRSTVEAVTGERLEDTSTETVADRVIGNTLNNLVSEIRRSIQFFESQSRGLTVGRLVLGGGSSRLKGLDAFIQSELKLPVEIIDPLRRIPVTGRDINASLLRDNNHMLSVGIGLALRKVVD